jgi:hypothetical protein
MKRSSLLLFLITLSIGITVLLHPYFQTGVPDTHDGNNHLVRFAGYKIALKESQFPPRWAPNLMNQYGYPVFNFNYPLSNILSVPLSIAKVNYELTFKILVALYVVIGALSLKKWLEMLSQNSSGINIAVAGWLFFPFLSSTIYYRGNIGEIAAYCLIPSMLYIAEYVRSHSISSKSIVFFSLAMTAFMLSHNLSVVFFLPLFILYALLRYQKNWRTWKKFSLIATISVLLSMWFWLPALAEMKLTNVTSTGLSKEYFQHFATIDQLLFSPLAFGYSVNGTIDGLSFSIGLATLIVVVFGLLLSVIGYLQNKKLSTDAWGLLGTSVTIVVLTFLQTSSSAWVWQLFSFAQVIQFPWRLSIYIGALTALGLYLLWRQNIALVKVVIVGAVTVALITTLQASVQGMLHRDRAEYDSQTITTDILSENRPKGFAYGFEDQWQPTAIAISGDVEVITHYWNGSFRSYAVKVMSDATIVEPTAYFEGWETTVSDGTVANKVDYLDDNIIRGRLAYTLKPGNYEVSSKFTQNTWPRLIGNAVSVGGTALLLFIVIKKIRYE